MVAVAVEVVMVILGEHQFLVEMAALEETLVMVQMGRFLAVAVEEVSDLAVAVGFEPTDRLPDHSISSAAH